MGIRSISWGHLPLAEPLKIWDQIFWFCCICVAQTMKRVFYLLPLLHSKNPPKCFHQPLFICISRAQWQELSFLWILVSFWNSQASSSSSVKVFFRTSQSISTEKLLQDTAYRYVILAWEVCECVICIQDFLKLYNVNPEKKKSLFSPVIFIIHFIFSKPLLPFLIYKCWWMRRLMVTVCGLFFPLHICYMDQGAWAHQGLSKC